MNGDDQSRTAATAKSPEQGALATAKGIITLFGTYLDGKTANHPDQPLNEEWQSLLTQLQDTNILSMPLLPEELRVALGHIDSENPARTLGYVREAFIRACSFVRAHAMA